MKREAAKGGGKVDQVSFPGEPPCGGSQWLGQRVCVGLLDAERKHRVTPGETIVEREKKGPGEQFFKSKSLEDFRPVRPSYSGRRNL